MAARFAQDPFVPRVDVSAFKSRLLTDTLDRVVDHYLFQGTSFIFGADPAHELSLKEFLARELGTISRNVYIVGSAKTGFSLSPDAFPREFGAQSDIDVAVVDTALFDQLWWSLLNWRYGFKDNVTELPHHHNQWTKQRINELFWGWFRPDVFQNSIAGKAPPRIPQLRDISVRWFNTFKKAPSVAGVLEREIHGRLYRTEQHARRYHAHGLSLIKSHLQSLR